MSTKAGRRPSSPGAVPAAFPPPKRSAAAQYLGQACLGAGNFLQSGAVVAQHSSTIDGDALLARAKQLSPCSTLQQPTWTTSLCTSQRNTSFECIFYMHLPCHNLDVRVVSFGPLLSPPQTKIAIQFWRKNVKMCLPISHPLCCLGHSNRTWVVRRLLCPRGSTVGGHHSTSQRNAASICNA